MTSFVLHFYNIFQQIENIEVSKYCKCVHVFADSTYIIDGHVLKMI